MGLSLSYFLFVIGAAAAVRMPDLGNGGHVDRVVDPPVPAQGQPVDLPAAGGDLGRGGAVVCGEVIAGGEPVHIDDVADDGAGVDRADTEHLGDGGPRGADGCGELLVHLAQ